MSLLFRMFSSLHKTSMPKHGISVYYGRSLYALPGQPFLWELRGIYTFPSLPQWSSSPTFIPIRPTLTSLYSIDAPNHQAPYLSDSLWWLALRETWEEKRKLLIWALGETLATGGVCYFWSKAPSQLKVDRVALQALWGSLGSLYFLDLLSGTLKLTTRWWSWEKVGVGRNSKPLWLAQQHGLRQALVTSWTTG
jgi:hypothetical protein